MNDEEIPEDIQLDHLCVKNGTGNRKCANPDHLEKVTGKVNTLRGMGPTAINKRKTRCKNGHELNDTNTYIRKDDGARDCRICARESKARKRKNASIDLR